jgi:ParB family chromosome partitioning protein
VELDPSKIEPASIRDRLTSAGQGDLTALSESIAVSGQLVPILVRPHPTAAGRYQAAYGHRRLAVMLSLSKPVRAIVKDLSDLDVFIAQGVENNERENLSYIEKALYAARLEDAGLARSDIAKALGAARTHLSTMLGLVRVLSVELIVAIGPAPAIGRPRWARLADDVQSGKIDWRVARADQQFNTLASDARFECVAGTAPKPPRVGAEAIVAADGAVLGQLRRLPNGVTVTIDERQNVGFSDFVVSQLPEIYEGFKALSEP